MTEESADINLGNITETVNNKADRDLQNTPYADLSQADYVIERGGVLINGTVCGSPDG